MKLNELKPQDGSTKKRMRVGRGIGSGKGKTSGRGVKGQKARTGVSIKGFEGGQMPLHRRLPKRGFKNIFASDLVEITLNRLQAAVDSKKLNASGTVTEDMLVEAGIVRRKKDGIKLVRTGTLTAKLSLQVTGATKGAIEAIEAAGGSVEVTPIVREPLDKTRVGKKQKRAEEKRAAAEAK